CQQYYSYHMYTF
nr:immunoglobulin light chain junction region [Mus musculus]NSL97884.1 immunoglobulin light chain junction region [Mus musculus]NSM01388.1 immunoglobulin light chain junction region [Mus musculus]NSM01701.1 immunoglobulin light chain junction region [Mus musculus]NSM02206.1 immunoglobulin light chain junction region [Mus musculus]